MRRCLSWSLFSACLPGRWRYLPTPRMLGDALVYGFSLYVVARGPVWKAGAAVAKAVVMGLFGAFVFAQLVYKLSYPQLPMFETMGAVGVLALVANGVCLALLWRHRSEDINMRSVWLCSRNDS